MTTSATDHPLIVELFKLVPLAGSVWPMDERALWFETMAAALNLIYPPPAVRIAIGLEPEEAAEHVVRTRLSAGEVANMGPGRLEVIPPAEQRAPIASRIEEVVDKTPAAPEPPTAAIDLMPPVMGPPKENVVLEPKSRSPAAAAPRPAGIPTTYGMIQIVLTDRPGLTARELVAEMAARWWPELDFQRVAPDISTWITKGRLSRDADGKLTLTEQGKNVQSVDFRKAAAAPPEPAGTVDVKVPERPQEPPGTPLQRPVTPPEPPPARVVSPAAARFAEMRAAVPAGPAPAKYLFPWGRETIRVSLREHRVLSKLKAAMGKGMLEGRILVDAAFAGEVSKPANIDMFLRELILQVTPRLDSLNLEIVGVPTMAGSTKIAGYVLREK